MKESPFGGSLFVFISKRRNKLKNLAWERNGFVLCSSASRTSSPGQSSE